MRIDLRSDTVTVPTPAMRQAMAAAEVGDDVFGDDPTVNRLEALAAETTGKEAALFVASGTMGNLASLLAHCGRGRDVILGDESHIYHYENGGGVGPGRPRLPPRPDERRRHAAARRAAGGHPPAGAQLPLLPLHAGRALICLENTHNRCGGRILSPEYFAEVAAIAAEHQPARAPRRCAALQRGRSGRSPRHRLDAPRLVGAVVPVERPVRAGRLAHLRSAASFVHEARRMRKILGGGMRQAGVIAAPGIVALTEMVSRLADDHRNARILADGVCRAPGRRPRSARGRHEHRRVPPAGRSAGRGVRRAPSSGKACSCRTSAAAACAWSRTTASPRPTAAPRSR